MTIENTEDLAFIQAGAEKAKINKANSSKGCSPGGTGKIKSNKEGELACFHCGIEDHWQYECPKLMPDERAALLEIIKKLVG